MAGPVISWVAIGDQGLQPSTPGLSRPSQAVFDWTPLLPFYRGLQVRPCLLAPAQSLRHRTPCNRDAHAPGRVRLDCDAAGLSAPCQRRGVRLGQRQKAGKPRHPGHYPQGAARYGSRHGRPAAGQCRNPPCHAGTLSGRPCQRQGGPCRRHGISPNAGQGAPMAPSQLGWRLCHRRACGGTGAPDTPNHFYFLQDTWHEPSCTPVPAAYLF